MGRKTPIGPFPAARLTQTDGTPCIVRPDRVDAVRDLRAGGRDPTSEVLLTGGGQVTVRGTSDEVLTLLKGAAPVELDAPLTALKLSQRARLALDSIGIRTVRELVSRTEADIRKGHLCGPRTLTEIQESLASHGLILRE
jgi:hypothetical protein